MATTVNRRSLLSSPNTIERQEAAGRAHEHYEAAMTTNPTKLNQEIADAFDAALDWPKTDDADEARAALRACILQALAGGVVTRTGYAADGSVSQWKEYVPDGPLRPYRLMLGVAAGCVVPFAEWLNPEQDVI